MATIADKERGSLARNTQSTSTSKKVLKAMSLFGSLQVIQILCSVIRTKLVAIWIGAEGVGLFGLYNGAIEMLSSATQLGIRTTAVRDIASASASRIALIIAVVRRWGWWLGMLGAVVTIALAIPLSQWTFGDDSHSWGFVLLSIVMLSTSITAAEQTVMQGLDQLKRLAQASLWGSLVAFLAVIPIYYFLRADGIVLGFVLYAVVTLIVFFAYRSRGVTALQRYSDKAKIDNKEAWREGMGFVRLGVLMTVSLFAAQLAAYAFIAYLNTYADTATVGYYNAGYTLFNRYVGLIFTAMAMEFYPRLARVQHSPRRTSLFVSHELGLICWILLAVVTWFIVLAQPMVRLLYSSEFLVIVPFITWAIVGVTLRASSWCMAFTILARGDGKVYLVTEVTSAAIGLALNILGYHLWGLVGLAASYIAWYGAYTLITWVVYRLRYGMSLDARVATLTFLTLIVTAGAAALMTLDLWPAALALAILVTTTSALRLRRAI
ncbi:MAG: oligosaccharide flippase family protein [Bacteroidales bacterium]|nr:oligosaccharide flippase family protein [Bacteroidales bacterium]